MGGLKDFFRETLKQTAAAYGELFGILVCFLLKLRTASLEETSAFAVFIITIGLVYAIGASFASPCSNRIQLLLREKKDKAAKNFFIHCLIHTSIWGFILMIPMLIYKSNLVNLMSSESDALRESSNQTLTLYIAFAWLQISMPTIYRTLCTLGQSGILILAHTLAFLFANLSILYFTQSLTQVPASLFANVLVWLLLMGVEGAAIIGIACNIAWKEQLPVGVSLLSPIRRKASNRGHHSVRFKVDSPRRRKNTIEDSVQLSERLSFARPVGLLA